MGIQSHNSNSSSGSSGHGNNLVVNHLASTPAGTDVLDKAVVVGERAAAAAAAASFQRANCATLADRLKRLQPLLDEVRESRMPGLESVEGALAKAQELLERCGPQASLVFMVSLGLGFGGCGLGVRSRERERGCALAV